MRIIGGRFRGKRLLSPDDRSVRPTGDRVRESLFSILDHQGLVRNARFLDLFCGTGAVGLEAYSRGAAAVWLMDQNTSLAAANLSMLDEPAHVRLCHQRTLTQEKPPLPFDVAFLDPPYGKGLVEPALSSLARGWLALSSWIIVECSSDGAFDAPSGFFLRQERHYGRSTLVFLGLDGHDQGARS